MKLLRLIAAALSAFVLVTAAPALAQRSPAAAPTGNAAESRDLPAPAAAPTGTVEVSPLGLSTDTSIGNISVVHMFMGADWIVKTVMILLLIASLWSWTIIFNKWLALGTLRRRAAQFEKVFWSGQSLDELYQQFSNRADHPMAAVFVSALRE
jgi:biopolymer transport protein TolQ